VLHGGGTAPVKWIVRRTIALATHPNPKAVLPVLIEAGAIADEMPKRDLLVSPDHDFLIDGHLIPAKTLMNSVSIRQTGRERTTYHHIELPPHAVLYAEGAPAETYFESGNRTAFVNGGAVTRLHPDFAQAFRDQKPCARLVEAGPIVEAVR